MINKIIISLVCRRFKQVFYVRLVEVLELGSLLRITTIRLTVKGPSTVGMAKVCCRAQVVRGGSGSGCAALFAVARLL